MSIDLYRVPGFVFSFVGATYNILLSDTKHKYCAISTVYWKLVSGEW